MKCPCKGCIKRKLACHSHCKEYEEWRIYYQAVKDDLREKGSLYISDESLRVYWQNLRRTNRKYAINKK